MGDEYKITSELLLKILSNQQFLLRLQIIGVSDGPVVLLGHQLLSFVKPHGRNFVHVGKRYI